MTRDKISFIKDNSYLPPSFVSTRTQSAQENESYVPLVLAPVEDKDANIDKVEVNGKKHVDKPAESTNKNASTQNHLNGNYFFNFTNNIMHNLNLMQCNTEEEFLELFNNFKDNNEVFSMIESESTKLTSAVVKHEIMRVYNNSPDDKKLLIIKSFKLLAAGDRSNALLSAMAKAEGTTEKDIANKILENFEVLVGTKDDNGEMVSGEDAQQLSHEAFSKVNYTDGCEQVQNMENDYEAYREKYNLDEIERKKPEELTPEEIDILEYAERVFNRRYAGAVTGTNVNENYTKENKVELLTTIDVAVEAFGIKEQVYTEAAQFMYDNKELFEDSYDNIIERMNQVTNNEYSEYVQKVIDNEILNSNKEETSNIGNSQKDAVAGESGEKQTCNNIESENQTTNLNFRQADNNTSTAEEISPPNTDSTRENNTQCYSTIVIPTKSNKTTTQTSEKSIPTNTNDFIEYVNKNKKEPDEIKNVLKYYEAFDSSQKKNILEKINSSVAFNLLLGLTENSVILSLDKCANFYMTSMVEHKKEKILEDNPNLRTCTNCGLMA